MDLAEVEVPYTNAESMQLWVINDDWQRACSNFFGEIKNKYLKSKCLQLIKTLNGLFPA